MDRAAGREDHSQDQEAHRNSVPVEPAAVKAAGDLQPASGQTDEANAPTVTTPTTLPPPTAASPDGRETRPTAGDRSGFECSGCGSTVARPLFDQPVPRSRGFEPVRCVTCALVAIHPMPTATELPALYEDDYYGALNKKFGGLMERAVGWFRRARVAWIENAGIRSGRVLDIGCARGSFLAQLQRRGFDVCGIELSEHAAQGARARLGHDRVHIGPLAECGFTTASFAAITAWQVFEHLPDPRATLAECHRLLRPGGALILAVPNIDSREARRSGCQWFHLDVPRHLYHFSPATLSHLLEGAGFEVETVSHHNLEQNPFGAIQSTLHRIGRPFCGLYDALRGARGRRWPATLGMLAAMPLAIVVSAWSAAKGSGATFTVRARRLGT